MKGNPICQTHFSNICNYTLEENSANSWSDSPGNCWAIGAFPLVNKVTCQRNNWIENNVIWTQNLPDTTIWGEKKWKQENTRNWQYSYTWWPSLTRSLERNTPMNRVPPIIRMFFSLEAVTCSPTFGCNTFLLYCNMYM